MSSEAAVDGFTQDDQSTSADWNRALEDRDNWMYNPAFMGLQWAVIPEFPEQDSGDAGGLYRATQTVDNTQGAICLEDSYIFPAEEMIVVTPMERTRHMFKLWYDQQYRRTVAIYDGYLGAGIPNPKKLGIAPNLIAAGNAGFQSSQGA